MTKPDEIAGMIAEAEKASARSTSSSTMPASSTSSPVEEFPVEKWDQIIAINLSSAFHAIRAALPGMKAKRLGPHHQHRLGACARRLALQVGLCRGQARHRRPDQDRGARVATHGITVNAICPGYVWTPLVEKQIPDTMKARGLTKEQVINDVLLDGAADQAVRHRRAGGGASRSSSAPTRRARSPARTCRWTAAGRRA